MIHRHLAYPAETEPAALPSAALVDILDRGDLDAWRPIGRSIAADPFGPLASRVLELVDAFPMYGTSRLWRAWIERCRARAEAPSGAAATLGELRAEEGLSQEALGERIGMSQSDVSKLERRADVRVSSLRRYLAGIGGRLFVGFERDGVLRRVELPSGTGDGPPD